MQVKFLIDFVLGLFPGFIPVSLADLFPVDVSAVQASEILQSNSRRINAQNTVISGHCLFGKHNAAVILSPDKDPVRLSVFIFLPCLDAFGDLDNDFPVHNIPLFLLLRLLVLCIVISSNCSEVPKPLNSYVIIVEPPSKQLTGSSTGLNRSPGRSSPMSSSAPT